MCLRDQHLGTCACDIISQITRIVEVCWSLLFVKIKITVLPPAHQSVLPPAHSVSIASCSHSQYCLLLTQSLLPPAHSVSIASCSLSHYCLLLTQSVLPPAHSVCIASCSHSHYCLLLTQSVLHNMPLMDTELYNWS
jgi:hypothetical protein